MASIMVALRRSGAHTGSFSAGSAVTAVLLLVPLA